MYRGTAVSTTKTGSLEVSTAVTLLQNERVPLILRKKATAKNVNISRDRFAGHLQNERIPLILKFEKLLCKNLVQLSVDLIYQNERNPLIVKKGLILFFTLLF